MSTASHLIRSTQLPAKQVHHLFDELPLRNLSALSSLLAHHLRNGDPLATWSLFARIHRARTDLTPRTFTPALAACSALPASPRGPQLHALMLKCGSDTQTVPLTALMDMYSNHSSIADSTRVFNQITSRDAVTWNTLISSYLKHSMPFESVLAFNAMRGDGIAFTSFTLCSLLKACASLQALKQGVQIHALIVTMGSDDLTVLVTALIDFYSHFGMIDRAIRIYSSLNTDSDTVMRNSFIAACVRNRRYGEALLAMSTMKPNAFSLTTALAACSENSDLRLGKELHCVAIRCSLVGDTRLCNALLDMYAKCGQVSSASAVFDRMVERDAVSWTSMIDAHGANGDGITAVELFRRMEGANHVAPNDVTVLAVLSACSRSGLVAEGRECFDLAQHKYGFTPGSKHYACYIDILGRAGLVEEMWSVYGDMVRNGTELTGQVWAALMNACGQNRDVSRGEFAARSLYELEPDKPGTYLLLSNFYAEVGKWEIADQLRSVMKGKGLFKNVGISWVSSVNNLEV